MIESNGSKKEYNPKLFLSKGIAMRNKEIALKSSEAGFS